MTRLTLDIRPAIAIIEAAINGIATDPGTQAPPLIRRFKLACGVGSMAEAVVYASTTQFVMMFYN